MNIVSVIDKNVTHTFHVENGKNLLSLLRENNFDIKTVCNSKGKCGKCKVVIEGDYNKPSKLEADLLGNQLLSQDYRLACFINIDSDITVKTLSKNNGVKISSDFEKTSITLNPYITKKYMPLEKPSLENQTADLGKVLIHSDSPVQLKDTYASEISKIIRENDFNVTSIYYDNEIIGVEPGNTEENIYGIAIDIGTTTVVAYLYNLHTGEKIGIESTLNPQRKFGYDVISRIDYTMESLDNRLEMHNEIIRTINTFIKNFHTKFGIEHQNIYQLTFVGNTTMMHFLMNFNAANIAVAPFIPVSTECHVFNSKDLGLKCSDIAKIIVFPCVSGYIGADTIGAVLASKIEYKRDISLLIDIGTNGEIVIGNNKKLISCSTAAGPAFEGANIKFGTGGVTGAIDNVALGDDIKITTINKYKPIGICGSGLVDAVSVMLEAEIIDETGRLPDKDEIPDNKFLDRLIEIDGSKAFILSRKENNGINEDIYITQKDIRELQNAKAAIFAGIMTLIDNLGIDINEIKTVYLAGGFGNYINVDSAINISLLPKEFKNIVKPIGNAAGLGSVMGLLSKKNIRKAIKLKNSIKYLELSANPVFTNHYMDAMIF